jgi:isopenicillin N synthase-like dioxygenase
MATDQLDQNAPAKVLQPEDIPNLDVGPLFGDDPQARAALIREITNACHDPGFFYIHNTCVSSERIEACIEATRQFFETPDDGPVKQDVHNRYAEEKKGWGPLFGEPSYQKGTIAHVESFDLGQQLTEDRYLDLGMPPNLWPDIPGFREVVMNYYRNVTKLGRKISEVISEILEMKPDFINSHSGFKAPRTLRLLHYPANDTPSNMQNVGISAHTDFECFTIMNQTAAGLELTNVDGEWCQAPSDIGTFTIILGDMTERFSNGTLKASGHRVVNTPWTRYSLILFFAVDGDYEVAPLPQFVSDQHPPMFEPVTQNDHIRRELVRASANRAGKE